MEATIFTGWIYDHLLADKTTTLAYYRVNVRHIMDYAPLGSASLDAITAEMIGGFITKRKQAGYEVSSINRVLQVDLSPFLRQRVRTQNPSMTRPGKLDSALIEN